MTKEHAHELGLVDVEQPHFVTATQARRLTLVQERGE